MRRGAGRAAAVLLAVAGLVASAGCSGGSPRPAGPAASPSTAPTSPAPTAAEQLAALARRAAGVPFTARYAARAARPPSRAQWEVWRSAQALRVDVLAHGVRATLVTSRRGAFACRAGGGHRVCFRVARYGGAVPAPFRLAAHDLFARDLPALAHPGRYDARVVAPVPGASCFAVRPRPAAPAPRRAIYCLRGDGLLAAVRYPTGGTVRLLSGHPGVPPPARLAPYASPTPLLS